MNFRRIIGDIFILFFIYALLAFLQNIDRISSEPLVTAIVFGLSAALWAIYFRMGRIQEAKSSEQQKRYDRLIFAQEIFDQDAVRSNSMDQREKEENQ